MNDPSLTATAQLALATEKEKGTYEEQAEAAAVLGASLLATEMFA